jgi:undecaprenyl-diphosphatase
MLDFMMSIDKILFHFINSYAISGPADIFFSFITESKNIWPFYGFLLSILLVKFGTKGRIACLFLLLTVFSADLLSTHIIKPFIGRERPCRALSETRKLIPCGPGQSFPSTHAINNACIAILLSLLFPFMRVPLCIIAFLIGYSRIYVGVHYPLDVLGGFIIGSLAGISAFFLVKKTEAFISKKNIS